MSAVLQEVKFGTITATYFKHSSYHHKGGLQQKKPVSLLEPVTLKDLHLTYDDFHIADNIAA